MSPLQHSLACAALLIAAAMPALAAGSAASSASESVGQSVGSSSTSIQKSSDASSKNNNNRVAQGDYRILDIAELAERPGMLRLRLQAVAASGEREEFFLLLPRQAAEQGQLAQGKTVTASPRPYGTQFAAADTKQAFFLVLDDEWRRELDTHAVL